MEQGRSSRGRELDARLAHDLEPPEPAGARAASAYMDELGRRPRLAPGIERRVVERAAAGDRAARARLVEAFLPLIAGVARVYRNTPTVAHVELVQEGVVGLLRALERYEPARGPFWAYASWWVRQAMQQVVSELTRPVVLSDRALRQMSRLRDAHGAHLQEHGREPTTRELAARTGYSDEHVLSLAQAERAPQSLEGPAREHHGELVGRFGDLLADPLSENEYEQVLDAIEADELRRLLAGLSDRERMILRARYGLDGPEETLGEIGERLGLSAERVRQLEQRALAKLRAGAPREPQP